AVNIYSGSINVSSSSPTITNSIIGVYAFSANSGNISVITNSGSSITSQGVGIDAVNEETPSATETATTNAGTSTSSATLSFASTPAWISFGMPVYDITTGKKIGTVAATSSNTVTLSTNATNPVGNGDTLSFGAIATTSAATSTASP